MNETAQRMHEVFKGDVDRWIKIFVEHVSLTISWSRASQKTNVEYWKLETLLSRLEDLEIEHEVFRGRFKTITYKK